MRNYTVFCLERKVNSFITIILLFLSPFISINLSFFSCFFLSFSLSLESPDNLPLRRWIRVGNYRPRLSCKVFTVVSPEELSVLTVVRYYVFVFGDASSIDAILQWKTCDIVSEKVALLHQSSTAPLIGRTCPSPQGEPSAAGLYATQ